MAYELLGKNFVPPDVHGKVTGKAKYAEDFRAEGMVFCKLLLSPMPHARVRNVDASAALALPGVHGVLRAADVTQLPAPAEPILTDEPMWVGQPILAVAADSEAIAEDAIDLIKVDFEELPFTVDPLQSLFPGGPDARTDGNVVDNRLIGPPRLQKTKWTAQDFARDLFPAMLRDGRHLLASPTSALVIDFGSPDRLELARSAVGRAQGATC